MSIAEEIGSDAGAAAALGRIMQLERAVRCADSEQAARYVILNETAQVAPYEQAFLWQPEPRGGRVTAVSGGGELDRRGEFGEWLEKTCTALEATGGGWQTPQRVGPDRLPAVLAQEWPQWLPAEALWCPLRGPDGTAVGAFLAVRSPPWQPVEVQTFAVLSASYGQALWAWRSRELPWRVWLARWGELSRKRRRWLIAGAAALVLFPVHQSAIAPAEVAPQGAEVMAAPVDGVVKAFHVAPNEAAKAGQPLFSLDDTNLRNRRDVAVKALAVAQADWRRASTKAFSDDASKAELAVLQARVQEREAEAAYLDELLERILVRAPHDGIAVYTDPNDWLGRPVATGERIMTLADPAQVEIVAHLPVADAITLDTGARLWVFLHAAPLSSFGARVASASYEAVTTPEGFAAYRVRAVLDPDEPPPRIGLKGTAKIYGSWVPLSYYLLRRPFATLRRTVGL